MKYSNDEPGEPALDRRIDRRAFLARMTAFTAAASMAAAAAPRLVRTANAAPVIDDGAIADEVRPEATTDLTELTISEAAHLLKKKKISPVYLVQAYLDRIHKFDSVYKAWNTVLEDQALAQAQDLEGKAHRSPLQGIPLAIKDNYYSAGVPTTANSHIFKDFVPDYDATCLARLKAAGAIVLGKTQMGPLATTRATTPDGVITTVNAWTPSAPSVDPGGSSTGSACAVAGRMACSSVGTQTGGSIVNPSNRQGLTGLKPTFGRNSLYGIIPLTYTRDHPGPLARDAMDAAIMLTAMAGPDPNDPRTMGLPKLPNLIKAATPLRRGVIRFSTRLGIIPGYTDGSSDDATARKAMISTFESLGVEVVEVKMPDEWDLLTGTAFNNVRLPERTEPFLTYLKQDVRLFGVSLGSWMQGLFMSGDEFLKGQRAKLILLKRVLTQLFSQCDAVVQTSPNPFDGIGLPELALPIGFGTDTQTGLTVPLGAIIGGLPYAEDRLLALAAAFQSVTDFHLQRPPDPAVSAVSAFSAQAELRLGEDDVVALSE